MDSGLRRNDGIRVTTGVVFPRSEPTLDPGLRQDDDNKISTGVIFPGSEPTLDSGLRRNDGIRVTIGGGISRIVAHPESESALTSGPTPG